MAVTFFPFNSIVVDGVPDRPANAENLAAYLAGFFSNGVLMQTDTALKVEASEDMLVQIHAGMGVINGKSIRNDSAHIIALDNASASLGRIDRIVIRLDETARYMMFDVLKGTPASNPVAPELTQAGGIYELCLAEIRVPAGASTILANYITDTRADADLCGVASIPPHMQDLEHGGTGISAETKEGLLLALGGTSKKTLWENASPSSNFARQILDVELADVPSNYDLIEIHFNMGSGSAVSIGEVADKRIPVGDNAWCFGVNGATLCSRTVTVNTNSIVIEGGVAYGTYGNTNGYNTDTHLIPTAIYGLKGVQ